MNTQISVRVAGQIIYSALATSTIELNQFKTIALEHLYSSNGVGSITIKPV